MGVSTGIELGLYTDIQSAFEEVRECEHSQHNRKNTSHFGEAEWYLQIQCPNCGNLNPLKPVCDRWKVEVEIGISIFCTNSCKEESYHWKIVVCEKIRK